MLKPIKKNTNGGWLWLNCCKDLTEMECSSTPWTPGGILRMSDRVADVKLLQLKLIEEYYYFIYYFPKITKLLIFLLFCLSINLLFLFLRLKRSTAWSQSGRSGPSATSPVGKDTPFVPGWSNWSRTSGEELVLRPSRGRSASSGNALERERKAEVCLWDT